MCKKQKQKCLIIVIFKYNDDNNMIMIIPINVTLVGITIDFKLPLCTNALALISITLDGIDIDGN